MDDKKHKKIMENRLKMNLSTLLNRFFDFYGIEKDSPLPNCNLSDIELRQMMIKLAKASYALGLQDSELLSRTFLEDMNEEKKQILRELDWYRKGGKKI